MLKRRQFISGLAAIGGSYLLSACGGGGADGGDNSSGSAATEAKAHAAASANGTAIPPASSITDSTGAVWTLSGGVVYRNGAKAGNTYNVTLISYYGNTIYSCGTGGQYYAWNGSGWVASLDPRMGGTSAEGTTLPASPYIIDRANDVWTLVNGVVYRNGATVGNTYNVSLVLWYGGKIWLCGTGGQFYVNVDQRNLKAQWLPSSDPRIAAAPAAGMFYGVNGHFDYTYTPAQLVSLVKGMGCTTYRVGCTAQPNQIYAVTKIAQAFQSAGLKLFVLINQGVTDANGRLYANEVAAYLDNMAGAKTIATALAPYGVTMYECGNELTRQDATVVDFSYAGALAVDFNNTNWPIMRGAMRGMIDGVKSIQPTAKCGINFCVADIGAADALWEGMQPDGTSGHQPLRWDITTWHNYAAYGDIFAIGSDGKGPAFDLPTYCKARYGVPFMITEWNTGPEETESFRASYITSQLTEFYAARKTHNIQSVMYYVLDSGNNTYGIMINGTPISQPYNAFTAFTSAHPDN
ncbi:hypothetical protein [Paraburkholderia kirstenboschensis]|uniref:Glycoside hydrolase family 5 domain-containing protein n=1 Tax=Paraburkholderia kirstenboschensis TaxID=1245436 RepID=A0ABZ0EQW6_9BURK|nr:hypothetical protein [Paraburkholderia kirstenboschensis]WOD18637.1 hypothetical protein RW095_38710 [Paraburkholderia kirstenboschensis]